MARKPTSHPTDGELEILGVLWEHGPLPLGEICTAMRQERKVATTTVATMLKLMLDKKLVRRSKPGGQASQWSAAVSRDKAAEPIVGKLIDRVFDGSARQLMAHLIEAEGLSDKEIVELRSLLNKKKGPVTKAKRTK